MTATYTQEGDVLLEQTPDGGNITVADGVTIMTGRFHTAIYLSLFGGNEDDPGGDDRSREWWGNKLETDPAYQYRSETQYLLRSLPATSGNLRRVEDAALRDLQWLLDVKAASSVVVSASIPTLNKIQINVTVEAVGEREAFSFTENWEAAA
jgi:phage gp46-like protein